ncbi:hypothetical protein [Paraburkholderia acidisoli]|uniref:Uncharacterized protein n=1 Tax=Paraburkholderia acidisoli TaxID=2571748 RepID=A0A7Z2GNA2_9BURK|nr:hypothetical protein [Paraburkholderia acidisoli]QGZ64908.1 hypothetical protein FAZ98_24190 [Paraburkholderia acidisoli]
MGLSTQNPLPDEASASDDDLDAANQQKAAERDKPARGAPGSFDQPEPHPEVMPREGGPHPEQTAEVPLGHHGESAPPGSRGHNSPPVTRDGKPGA